MGFQRILFIMRKTGWTLKAKRRKGTESTERAERVCQSDGHRRFRHCLYRREWNKGKDGSRRTCGDHEKRAFQFFKITKADAFHGLNDDYSVIIVATVFCISLCEASSYFLYLYSFLHYIPYYSLDDILYG